MTTSIVFPASAAPALGFLKSSQNDIEVYVEDSSAPNIWVKLLQKFLPAGIRLNSVNILGGRKNVIEACKLDQVLDGRRKIYLIDADLDLVKGSRKPNLRHLYRLRAYCLENYLLQERALIAAATTFDTAIDEFAARAKLNFSGWVSKISDILRGIFVCYAATNELLPEIPTVSYSVYNLRDATKPEYSICKKKAGARVVGLVRALLKAVPASELRIYFDELKENSKNIDPMRFASGKDYIFPFIFEEMKRLFKVGISKEVFKVFLAGHSEASFDPFLVRRLARICA